MHYALQGTKHAAGIFPNCAFCPIIMLLPEFCTNLLRNLTSRFNGLPQLLWSRDDCYYTAYA